MDGWLAGMSVRMHACMHVYIVRWHICINGRSGPRYPIVATFHLETATITEVGAFRVTEVDRNLEGASKKRFQASTATSRLMNTTRYMATNSF